jgi:hypothetical protein
MSKLCRYISILLCFLFVFVFVGCTKEVSCTCNCTPQIQEPQPQPQITIVAEYEHNRHDGRKDTIYIYSDNTYEWVVSMNGVISRSYFFTAEELFEFATTYKFNWDHNKWIKVER